MPKLKYIASPNKTIEENKKSEKIFRTSVKYIFIQMILGFVAGILWSQYILAYVIIGSVSFEIIRLNHKSIENTFRPKLEHTIYLLIGTIMGLYCATISSGIILFLKLLF